MNLPLDCFDVGEDCSVHADCDSCIESGCGWCSAGFDSQHSCMAGGPAGPFCDTCGTPCGCNWDYGRCPTPKAELAGGARRGAQRDAAQRVGPGDEALLARGGRGVRRADPPRPGRL
eukprot:CAMPEP_0172154870 /NCGR_PEP_ID=MMETSP1050-20130122/2289_1 /TAXON_ID=233186 /ORGANISM="Cryptomonas curvata, Strain CCAP979/52" /LENGTH=116 /DNA_ID=CAMNT_0012823663 /DNA_START=421 /DNA_END=767 /DNA_ORIENTATION=-